MMSDDLISRQAATKLFENMVSDATSHGISPLRLSPDYVISGIEALPSAQKWIPCNERLPEFGVKVLVYNTNGDVYSDYIIETPHGKKIWCEASAYDVYDIVAWMPLPEPYKEK